MNVFSIVLDTLSATSTKNFTKTSSTPIISAGDGTTGAKLQPLCSIYDIAAGSVIKMAAVTSGTPQVTTLTPVGTTNGITYSIKIIQLLPVTEDYYMNTYTIKTPATGSITATTISAQLIAAVNADPNLKVTASGSSTCVLTADAGYETFQVFILDAGYGLTQATSQVGIYTFGITPYYDLARTQVDTSTLVGSSAGYTLYSWVANNPDGQTNMDNTKKPVQINVWVNLSDTNGSALVTAIDAIWSTNIGIVGAVGTR